MALVVPHISTARNSAKPFTAADEPMHTIVANGAHKSLVAATMIQMGYGEREGQAPRVLDVETPVGTVVASGNKFALVAAFMAQHNTGVVGREVEKPLSTTTARGTQQQVVTSYLVKLRNNCVGQPVEQPVDTITGGGLHFGEVRAFLIKYYGNEDGGHGLDAPLGAVTTRDRFGLVTCTIDGVEYAIADIGMRMLSPRELFNAQGFPPDYIIDPLMPNGKPLTKTAQIGRCGNSVSPVIPEALVRANLPDICSSERIAA